MVVLRAINLYLPRSTRSRRRWTIGGICLTFLLFVCYFSWNVLETSFECPYDINKGHSPQLSANGINIFSFDYYLNRKHLYNKEHGYEKLLLDSECIDISSIETSKTFKICIYDPSKDLKISWNLKTYGFWERENVVEMVKAFKMHPKMMLVDLGSNVGTLTLQAATRGVEVIAVDALLSNHVLLHRSLVYNDLSCNVTLCHNAIHGHRGRMRVVVNPSNFGNTVVSEIPGFGKEKIQHSQQVDAICLDDLVPLTHGKEVFLKMDLEGTELAALTCAHQFFTRVNVKILMIEWIYYRENEKDSNSIKSILTSYNMIPTWGVDRDRPIDLEASHAWPDNVIWMKM